MDNYTVTIGYNAVIEVDVKANSLEEAMEKGLKQFDSKEHSRWFKTKNNVSLLDDTYDSQGARNDSMTWEKLNY